MKSRAIIHPAESEFMKVARRIETRADGTPEEFQNLVLSIQGVQAWTSAAIYFCSQCNVRIEPVHDHSFNELRFMKTSLEGFAFFDPSTPMIAPSQRVAVEHIASNQTYINRALASAQKNITGMSRMSEVEPKLNMYSESPLIYPVPIRAIESFLKKKDELAAAHGTESRNKTLQYVGHLRTVNDKALGRCGAIILRLQKSLAPADPSWGAWLKKQLKRGGGIDRSVLQVTLHNAQQTYAELQSYRAIMEEVLFAPVLINRAPLSPLRLIQKEIDEWHTAMNEHIDRLENTVKS